MSDAPLPRDMRYSVLFVCQRGELEIKSVLLAASLKHYLRCTHELVAAIPAPVDAAEQPGSATLATLRSWGVRIAHLPDRLDAARPFTNKIGCLRIPTTADKRIFLDSDILCLHTFADEPRFRVPFNAKPADRQTFTTERDIWLKAFAVAGVPPPAALVPTTVSKQHGLPYFNSGFVAVHTDANLADAWSTCAGRIAADGTVPNSEWWLDQVGLAIAVRQLGLAYDCLDERYNYPAHIKPLPARELPYFCHYHTVDVIEQEPRLRALLLSLADEYPELRQIAAEHAQWARLLAPLSPQLNTHVSALAESSTTTEAPQPQDLLLTGIPSSGAEWLCGLLSQDGRALAYDEPSELSGPLAAEAVPWTVATFHRRARAESQSSIERRGRCDPARSGETTVPQEPPHVVATKMAPGYLFRITALRRAMPEAQIVVCMNDPFSTVAAWKGGPAALREVDLAVLLPAFRTAEGLTHKQSGDLTLLAATADRALRRALWWQLLAEVTLDHLHEVTLLRWADVRVRPAMFLANLLPSGAYEHVAADARLAALDDDVHAALDEADKQAIRAVCSQAAAELGVWPYDIP